MNRRQSLKLIAGAAGALAVTGLVGRNAALAQTAPAQPAGPFKLPPLGYAYEALEPSIDGQTMMIHHQRHHGAYVNGLNGLVGRYPDLANAAAAPEALLSDMSKVPHPLVQHTMELLRDQPAAERAKVWFIHMNHGNPLLWPDSPQSRLVLQDGFNIAREGQRLPL